MQIRIKQLRSKLAQKLIMPMCLLLCLIACDKSEHFNVKRVIANESGSQVRIEIYSDGNSIESISIASGDSNEKLESCLVIVGSLTCDSNSGIDLRWESFADSAQVFFDEVRIQTFCGKNMRCNQSQRNIFFFPLNIAKSENATGYVESVDNDVQTFTYTINNEDFENAEPIDE